MLITVLSIPWCTGFSIKRSNCYTITQHKIIGAGGGTRTHSVSSCRILSPMPFANLATPAYGRSGESRTLISRLSVFTVYKTAALPLSYTSMVHVLWRCESPQALALYLKVYSNHPPSGSCHAAERVTAPLIYDFGLIAAVRPLAEKVVLKVQS